MNDTTELWKGLSKKWLVLHPAKEALMVLQTLVVVAEVILGRMTTLVVKETLQRWLWWRHGVGRYGSHGDSYNGFGNDGSISEVAETTMALAIVTISLQILDT